jgi:WD40 repeat protein
VADVSADGSGLVVADGSVIRQYSVARRTVNRVASTRAEPAGEFRGHAGYVSCVALSPDESRLASTGKDGTIRIWDVASRNEIRVFAPKLGPLHWVAFAPDGLTLAFSSQKGHIGLLDLDE